MLFMNELLTYLFKFIVLGVVAVAGVLCGIKIKKNKIAKSESSSQNSENA